MKRTTFALAAVSLLAIGCLAGCTKKEGDNTTMTPPADTSAPSSTSTTTNVTTPAPAATGSDNTATPASPSAAPSGSTTGGGGQ